MAQDLMLFRHALARFRSRFPLASIDRVNREHAFDVALALRHSCWALESELPDLAILRSQSNVQAAGVCLAWRGEFFDLMGSNALSRFEESMLLPEGSCEALTFSCVDAAREALADLGYFVDHWEADADEIASIRDGVAAAAQDFSAA